MNISDELSITNTTINNPFLSGYIYYIYSSAYTINFILGLPINFYVLWLIFMGKGSGFVSEFFNLNLTICEMLFCCSAVSFFFSLKTSKLLLLIFFVAGIPICGRPLFLCLICVERYVAVVYPVTFLKYKPLRYRLACCAVVWIVVLGSCVFCVLFISVNDMYVFICVVLPLWLLLFFVKLFCCLGVVRALKNPGPGQKEREKDEPNQVKRKAVTVILIITVATVIQYSPTLIAALLYRALSRGNFDVFWTISSVTSLFVGYVHAFLFILRTGCLSSV